MDPDVDAETDDDDTAQYNLSNRNLAAMTNGQHPQPKTQGAGDDTIKGIPPGAGHKRNSSEYSGDWAQ